MTKVIQIRGISDDVHAKLVAAADREGRSLTAYLLDVLAGIARRAESVEHNRQVILAAQAEFGSLDISRADTLAAIEEGRAERDVRPGDRADSRGA